MANFRKVERVSATMQVVNAVKEALKNGDIKVGDKLPNEAEMSKTLGVGRSSFREGMRILSAYGVVEIRQGEGTFVVDHFAEHVFEFLGFLPTQENFTYLIELRRMIELGCIRLICQRATGREGEYKELEIWVNKLKVENPIEENIYADMKFHETLVGYTQNPFIIQIYKMISSMMSTLVSNTMQEEKAVYDAQRLHHKIYDAICTGNLEASMAAMDEHLNTVMGHVKKQ